MGFDGLRSQKGLRGCGCCNGLEYAVVGCDMAWRGERCECGRAEGKVKARAKAKEVVVDGEHGLVGWFLQRMDASDR